MNINKNIKLISLSIIFVSIIFYIIFKEYEGYNSNYKLFAIGIFLLNFLPLIYFFFHFREQNFLPIFYLTLVYFFFCYTIFYVFDFWNIWGGEYSGALAKLEGVNHYDIYKSLKIFFLGILLFNIGFFSLAFFFNQQRNGFKIFKIKSSRELIIITIFVNFITLIFFYFLSISNIIPSISQIKFPLVFLLLALNVFVVTKIDIKKIYKIFFIIPILVIFYLEIIKGSYAFPFIILIFCYVLYFLLTKKIMFLPIFFSIIIFIILHSYKYEYRIATWYNNHQSNNLIYKSSSLVNAFKNYSDKFFNINSKKKLYSFTNRNVYRIFHSTESLIIVSKLTPDEVPHWKGESYKILSSKIIPRIFWKNKPSDTLGNQYGQRYKILFDGSKVIQDPFGSNIVLENALEMDKGTSWNMPTLNEFYVNFGIFGVIIGMFILGALYRLFAVLLSTRNHDNYEFIIGFATIFPLFFLESHLSILFGAVLQTLIFLILFILSSKVSINLIEKFVFNEKKNN